jgi:hypothetical protein
MFSMIISATILEPIPEQNLTLKKCLNIIKHILPILENMWVGASAPTLWRCQAWSESVGAEAPTHMVC